MLVQLCAESCTERRPRRYICADHGGVAVQVEAAFDIEHRGDLAAAADALDVRRGARELDASGCCVAICSERAVQHAQRLLGLEARRVVVLGHEDGEEQRAEAALFGARQVELAVRLALADIAAVVELAVDAWTWPSKTSDP